MSFNLMDQKGKADEFKDITVGVKDADKDGYVPWNSSHTFPFTPLP